MVLDGGRTPGGVPSTLVDCLAPDLRVLRAGPISETEIQALAGQNLSSGS